jgi:hypothetical protein
LVGSYKVDFAVRVIAWRLTTEVQMLHMGNCVSVLEDLIGVQRTCALFLDDTRKPKPLFASGTEFYSWLVADNDSLTKVFTSV